MKSHPLGWLFLFLGPMKNIIITIDGWSSTGKSTLARQLAKELNYMYIDSGAMYRAITLYFIRHHVDWTIPQAVVEALKHIQVEFVANHKSGERVPSFSPGISTVTNMSWP
jgi:cytidylate kinase